LYEYVNSPEKYKGLALPSDLVVLYQIISAVHFLHDIEIVHGDLNPLTICIESHNSETSLMVSARIKVRESFNVNNENIFKYEEHAGNEQQLEDLKICKSKYWRRAERIDCQPEYGDDIFAVGFLLYYFIKGQHPFAELYYSSNEEKILENISKKTPTHFFDGQYDTCIFIDLIHILINFIQY
jgi:serine/threonine protein kinase